MPIFKDQPIQGINVQDERVIVWGGSSLAVVPKIGQVVDGKHDIAEVIFRTDAPDWIYAAKSSPSNAADAALITAHNEIIPFTFPANSQGQLRLGNPISPSRPILYSGTLSYRSQTEILTIGGTAFGEILVWKCDVTTGQHEMLHVLFGHEGSIFGVDLWMPSSGIDVPQDTILLASCSDDRTVRVWDITDQTGRKSQRNLDQARETGFGALPSINDEEEASKIVAMGMGHASRIWGVKFTQRPDLGAEKSLHLYSFGEDGMVQKWAAHLTDPPKPDLSLLESCLYHDGKHIWSSALATYKDQSIVVSGGADGKISQIDDPHIELSRTKEKEQDGMLIPLDCVKNINMQDILDSLDPNGNTRAGKEIIKRFGFISDNVVLITTTIGRLLVANFAGEQLHWEEVEISQPIKEDIRLCYVMKTVGHDTAVLGTSSGKLYWFSRKGGIHLVTSLPWKIVEICHLKSHLATSEPAAELTEMIIYLYGRAEGYFLAISPETGKLEYQHELQGLDARFRTTSASKIGKYLFLGSRHGWLSVLAPQGGESKNPFTQVTSVGTPSRDSITSITPLPSTSPTLQALSYVLLTTRDGKYRIYSVDPTHNTLALHLMQETALPFGPFIEGAWFTSGTAPHLILYGFKHKYFIVWNETLREEIASVDCGGAHREFSFTPCHGHEPWESSLRFSCTKTSSLMLYHQSKRKNHVIQPGTHGREIRAVSCSGEYVATGAEDCSIRIWGVDATAHGRLKYLTSMKNHITGIQRLKWVGQNYLLSSAGNEDFFIWRVEKIEAGYDSVGTVCEGIFKDKTVDGDLRIMDFDTSPYSDNADEGMIISMAFSDSTIKTYRYTHDGTFHSLARGRYTGACVTQLRHLRWLHSDVQILTAATDGHLALWRARLGDAEGCHELVLQQTLLLHQSTIKCLDMKWGIEEVRIITGGDDNALGTALIKVEEDGSGFEISQRGIVRKAHAASINSVVLVPSREGLMAASVSNDQRIKLWTLEFEDRVSVRLLKDVYSGVADPGDMDVRVTDEGEVALVIGGVGVETWKLSS